jgi:Co/Zn/Cd efflux system component
MPLITNHKITVVLGLLINLAFVALKFVVFLKSHVGLFFADAIDSFVDCFVIFLIVVFLRFNLNGKLSFLTKDFLECSQWSAVIVFRAVIVLDAIDDLLNPQPRVQPLLVIITSAVVLGGGILLAFLFVDEDDIVKFFIDEEEKLQRKLKKKSAGAAKAKESCKIMPVFAEALDNLVTAAISLVLGIFMYFNLFTSYIYIIDDVSNLVVSAVMCVLACRGLWRLAGDYQHKSYDGLISN